MRKNNPEYSIGLICRTLDISRSAYYRYGSGKYQSERSIENARLLERIRTIYLKSKCRYGSPRITTQLRAEGVNAGKNRVARIIKLSSISVKVRQKRRNYMRNKERQINTDLVVRQFNPLNRNRIWGSDITYIRTKQGRKYLSVVMDLYSRMIIAWEVYDSQSENIIIRATETAEKNRNPQSGLILHSDRGTQYCSTRVRTALECYGIGQSMGAKATCYDNAVLESFF
ncbi:MAG: IS3 family transposase [Ignavibacteria bacterium]|nr:IS3 family transposase [Ignavibacteria bacterium]